MVTNKEMTQFHINKEYLNIPGDIVETIMGPRIILWLTMHTLEHKSALFYGNRSLAAINNSL